MKEAGASFLLNLAQDAYEFIKRRWYRRETLLFVVAISFLLFLFLGTPDFIQQVTKSHLLFSAGFAVFAAALWYVTTRRPKSPKNKIGFGIGILAETKIQQEKLVNDFVITLRNLLLSRKFRYKFHFINFSSHFVEQIQDQDDAKGFLKGSRLKFFVYGRARTRSINGVDHHFLELEGVVAHSTLNPRIQSLFTQEFSDLFPRRITISSENDIFSFEFTAELIKFVAMYIIGIAVTLSGDPSYGQELFEDLDNQLKTTKLDLPAIVKIKERLPTRLTEVYYLQVYTLMGQWFKTKDTKQLSKVKTSLDKLGIVAPNNYNGHLIRSLWIFVVERNIDKAKKEILKCKGVHDVTWRYSYAFLLAYEGDLSKANKEYKRAFKGVVQPIALKEITDFITWILQKEPEKVQLRYCLGIIYLFQLKENSLAREEFEKFIQHTTNKRYNEQIRLSIEYINTLKTH